MNYRVEGIAVLAQVGNEIAGVFFRRTALDELTNCLFNRIEIQCDAVLV